MGEGTKRELEKDSTSPGMCHSERSRGICFCTLLRELLIVDIRRCCGDSRSRSRSSFGISVPLHSTQIPKHQATLFISLFVFSSFRAFVIVFPFWFSGFRDYSVPT